MPLRQPEGSATRENKINGRSRPSTGNGGLLALEHPAAPTPLHLLPVSALVLLRSTKRGDRRLLNPPCRQLAEK
ncbi:hypothetical protein INS49_005834 [Diaporthe citri]|uniref:uncharacterized protein n=1 Tax=Diaporthe citri TaxID=83186 RepID=UPI001C82740F|nr:uncharacterized protein INS49_005834 [Diaporthe citri]KAG6364235.1 hypothetical protein INS49_005834 [Diaporthe citri]